MIKTIIFDIGNVLADFTWKEHYMRFGYTGEMLERLADATVRSEQWNEIDRGVLSDEEVLQCLINNDPEIEADIRRCLVSAKGMVKRNDYAIPWIKELQQKGYQVLYLSNFGAKAERDCAEALDFLPHMDGGILSYREKVVKPMPEIYEILINRYHLIPEECVFLDDTERNLTAAAAYGIHTIHFENQKQAIEELKNLGVD